VRTSLHDIYSRNNRNYYTEHGWSGQQNVTFSAHDPKKVRIIGGADLYVKKAQ